MYPIRLSAFDYSNSFVFMNFLLISIIFICRFNQQTCYIYTGLKKGKSRLELGL
jgi:hypothetical protein